jgi:hypothetical protein
MLAGPGSESAGDGGSGGRGLKGQLCLSQMDGNKRLASVQSGSDLIPDIAGGDAADVMNTTNAAAPFRVLAIASGHSLPASMPRW